MNPNHEKLLNDMIAEMERRQAAGGSRHDHPPLHVVFEDAPALLSRAEAQEAVARLTRGGRRVNITLALVSDLEWPS